MLFALVLVCGVYLSGTFGSSYKAEYGFKNYTKYEPGTMNLIITAPHGGSLKPKVQSDPRQSWPSRTFGCKNSAGHCVWRHVSRSKRCKRKDKCKAGIINDKHTSKIARDIANRIKAITGDRPHVVYSNLHRSKLDANREINEATFNIPDAKRAYEDYHGFINKALKAIRGRGTHGLILDIHGQGHKPCLGERIELGYLIGRQLLNSGNYTYSMTSVRGLAKTKCHEFLWISADKNWRSSIDEHCFKELISGDTSLGHYLNIESLPAVPSPFIEKPGSKKDGYFSGGYTVQTYGSKRVGEVDAIQIEFPQMLRSKLASNKTCSNKIRNKVVFAILCFFKENYNYSPSSYPYTKKLNEFTKKCPHVYVEGNLCTDVPGKITCN